MLQSETKPLLPNNKARDEKHGASRKVFIVLPIVLILFKGFDDMASVTLKQFVYSWCKENVNSNNSTGSKMSSAENTNDSKACDVNKTTDESEDKAQDMASDWELYFNTLSAVLVFFSVVIFGTISDYAGRKVFLCLALAGRAILFLTVTGTIYFNLHIKYMLAGYAVDGLLGSEYMVSFATYTSTADVTTTLDHRILGITVMECIFAVGRLSTQFGNGYFIQQYGYLYPFITSTSGVFLALLITLIAFPETLPTSTMSASKESSSSSGTDRSLPSIVQLMKNYLSFYTAGSNHRKTFWLCLIVFFLYEVAVQCRTNTLPLHQLGWPFCWSPETIGWYNAAVRGVYIVGCVLLKPLQLCISQTVIACIGIMSECLYNIGTGLVTNTVGMFAGTCITLLLFFSAVSN